MASQGRDDDPLVITGLGLVTSVGHLAAQALTSLRAGIARLVEFPAYEPILREPGVQFPEPLVAGPVTGVTDGLAGIERLFALAVPAVQEALEDAGFNDGFPSDAALLVAGGDRPQVADGSRVATVFVPRLANRITKRPLQRLHYYPAGSAGSLRALADAAALLRRKICRYCVIGGVDSWLDADTLRWLDEHRRLKSQSNPDSFIPGEAAAFVVIESASSASQRGKKPYAECTEVSTAQEEHTVWDDGPCTAQALSECLRAAVTALASRNKPPGAVLCDLNGENYRSTEWGYALTRAFRNGQPVPPLVHPADCIGDTGAASGAILLGLAAFGVGQEAVPWNEALVWCSSDSGLRAALGVVGI